MLKANIIVDLDPSWAGRGFDMNGEDITFPPSVFIPEGTHPPFCVIQNGNRVVQVFETIDQLEQRLLEMERIAKLNANICCNIQPEILKWIDLSELVSL